jgi:hypothetical protein
VSDRGEADVTPRVSPLGAASSLEAEAKPHFTSRPCGSRLQHRAVPLASMQLRTIASPSRFDVIDFRAECAESRKSEHV